MALPYSSRTRRPMSTWGEGKTKPRAAFFFALLAIFAVILPGNRQNSRSRVTAGLPWLVVSFSEFLGQISTQ
jgi:hypothetical protein